VTEARPGVPASARWRVAAVLTLLAWCAGVLAVRRTAAITDDWQGWRQADTEAIARNLAFEELDPLRPRIDWRGDGPGYVETELQLYPTLIALVLRLTGDTVWPGQLISLACIMFAAALVFAALARRFGGPAAYLALVAILGHQGTIVIATSIQPDALALLAFTIGFLAFVRYLALRAAGPVAGEAPRGGRSARAALVIWIAATAIAGLVKPTTLELGIVQFVLVLHDRRALRDVRVWIGWGVVLVVAGAYLGFARSLYVTYGNTFGVLSGGDSKLPAVAMLASSETWLGLARYGVLWGVGVPAIPAALYLAWRRRLGPEPIALAAGALAVCLVALRYMSGPFGTHYHLPHIVLGGWLVAAAAADLGARQIRSRLGRIVPRALAAGLVVAALALGARGVRFLRALPPEPETALGARLAGFAAPGMLVAVRARAGAYDPEWRTVNNFEDPRVFYLSRTHGWVLPNDLAGAARLAEVTARGARFYVHVHQTPIDGELAAWLATHAVRVERSPAGEIYRLGPAGDASPTK
jgi:4-amino-4-deoxy-L-arabinose transferase-like glycosyltransferase